MARKSNKTAHVLNLLSGQQEAGGEAEKEIQQAPKAEEAPEAPKAAPEPEPVKTPAVPSPEVPSNISIIDGAPKEDDPIAEKIREELLKDLEPEAAAVPEPVADPEPEKGTETLPEPEPEPTAAPEAKAETQETKQEPPAEAQENKQESPAEAQENKQESAIEVQEPLAEAAKPEPEPAEEILELAPEPEAEPEPDYIMLNVMQRIVEDKIIYFMKQFEVCTCPRCKADTIALTLSGLPAKYKIVDKFAVDPLVSYYTSRLISQVTVEALKACTQVKDNPRH